MGKIKRFEDIKSWQKVRQLTNMIYDLSRNGMFAKDFELRNQIRRAAGSSIHKIAEGFDAGTDPEFCRFLKMARRSASEVQSQRYPALDRHSITETQRQTAYTLATEVKRLVNGLIACLNK